MERGKFVLVTGGSRSGKSKFAEQLAGKKARVTYIATAEAFDEEMTERIRRHRQRRPAHWLTIEEPRELVNALISAGDKTDLILVDCLTVLMSNLLLDCWGNDGIATEDIDKLLAYGLKIAKTAKESPSEVIIVTNEVGMGLIPPSPLGRVYRDLIGSINQEAAELADEVYLVVSGIPMKIKG